MRPPTPLEARNRGTSVYFPSQVIPMLPERRNGPAPAYPAGRPPVYACEMTVSSKGRLTGYKFYEAANQLSRV
ncbi:RNB domain-containing ribonuclease [Escherichia coli]